MPIQTNPMKIPGSWKEGYVLDYHTKSSDFVGYDEYGKGARSLCLLPDPNTELVMSMVFIGGSRRLSRLNATIRGRLDNIIERNHAVLIGDANGGDRAVQAYLAERGYRSVTVYCTNNHCRNNVGKWPVRSVAATDQRGFDYYALKDAAMAADAECGFMLWDGKSKGTLFNIRRLLDAGKPVVVYLASDHACHTIRREDELTSLVARPLSSRKQYDGGNPTGQGALFPRERGELATIKPKLSRHQKQRRAAEP